MTTGVTTTIPYDIASLHNIGLTLSRSAELWPDSLAIAEPRRRHVSGRADYRTVTYAELEEDSNRLANAMRQQGLESGMRVALMVRPGIDFISFTFALFKAGAVIVLIDPGMGKRHMVRCLEEVRPEGFVAIPLAHMVRIPLRSRFPSSRLLVTVGGRRWGWGGTTAELLRHHGDQQLPSVSVDRHDDAAIIFTTGSTGPPKGVRYTHQNFLQQVSELSAAYGMAPGEIDLPCFPLFALFNLALGLSTVIPQMDPTRPAQADPEKITAAINLWQVTQAFASPALWNVIGIYCERTGVRLPSLGRVLSAGAPVPPHVLRRMEQSISDQGEVFTPYGATEALPVAHIGSHEVLGETESSSLEGAGTCVGRRFPGIEWRVIELTDEPLPSIDQTVELPHGEIGELIVRGEVVTRDYVTRRELTRFAKLADGATFWHRMGDVGYLDRDERFWFCGRKSHRVTTADGVMFTVPCEAIANCHPRVYRSALVGTGHFGRQVPTLVVECWPNQRVVSRRDAIQLRDELFERLQRNDLTRAIARDRIVFRRQLPVDIRHNAKIFREQLACWVARRYPTD